MTAREYDLVVKLMQAAWSRNSKMCELILMRIAAEALRTAP